MTLRIARENHRSSDGAGGRTHSLLILTGLAVALAIRYYLLMTQGREGGSDTWIYHQMAGILADRGSAPWLIHPTSYLGMYPFSDSSGSMLIVAALSLVSGMSIEGSIIVVSFVLGALLYLSGFLLGKTASQTSSSSILLGFAFSFAPILFHDTVATLSPRVMSVVVISFVPVLLLRTLSREGLPGRRWLMALAVLLLFGGFLIHKLAIFGGVFIVAFLARPLLRPARLYAIGLRRSAKAIALLLVTATVIATSLLLTRVIQLDFLQSYQIGAFFAGEDTLVELLNIGSSQAGGVGVAWLLLGLPGLVFLLLKADRTPKESFILIAILVAIPLLFIRTYARPFMPLVLLLTLPMGVTFFRQVLFTDRKKTLTVLVIVATVIATPGFALWMDRHFKGLFPEYVNLAITPDVSETAAYIHWQIPDDSMFASANPLVGEQVCAMIDRPSLPGLYGPQDWMALYYGVIGRDQIDAEWRGLGGYLYTSDTERQMMNDYVTLMLYRVDSSNAQAVISKYGLEYVIKDESIGNSMPGWDYKGTIASSFLQSLAEKRYKIYDNGAQSLWSV